VVNTARPSGRASRRKPGLAAALGAGGADGGGAVIPTEPELGSPGLLGAGAVRRLRAAVDSTLAPGVGAAAVYAAAAIFVYHRILFAPTSSMPGCNCGDQAQEVWFLRWPLYAVQHGLNPFFSTWMNYPKGVNLAINTASPLLGLVSAPLQLTVGTVETYDVLLVVALATSALAMCLALRRWVRSWGAAFVGGLLYGFSPYMIGQGGGHVFLVVLFIPPIVLVLLHEIVVVQSHGAVRDGVLLGILLALQYYISPEVLAMTVVVSSAGVVLLAVARRHDVRERIAHAASAVLLGAVVCGAALAYPLWMSTHGPQHVVGPPHPLSALALFPGDLLGPILPTSNQLLSPHALSVHGNALVGDNASENGMYLGVPLVVVLSVFAWVYRRRRAILFFEAMVVVALVFALGSQLVVANRHTGVPLPGWILDHLPFLQDILDVRFSLFMQLAAAAALAVGLDDMVAAARAGGRQDLLSRLGILGAPTVVAIVGLAPLIPASPYPAAATNTPAFFTSQDVDRIPAGSAVLTYPYPLRADAEWLMTFQTQADMRFKLFGGDAFVPDGPGGTSVPVPAPLAPTVVEHLFSDAYTPGFAKVQLGTAPGAPAPVVDAKTVAALRTFLQRYHVSTVVVGYFGLSPHTVVRYVSDAIGRPEKTGGVWAWFDVPRLLAQHGRTP
jgi:hypothetical protein